MLRQDSIFVFRPVPSRVYPSRIRPATLLRFPNGVYLQETVNFTLPSSQHYRLFDVVPSRQATLVRTCG